MNDPYLDMTLQQFSRGRDYFEVNVPGLPVTLWFVPARIDAERLQGDGIPVGRIWTARELSNLVRTVGMTHEAALALANAKVHFNAVEVK